MLIFPLIYLSLLAIVIWRSYYLERKRTRLRPATKRKSLKAHKLSEPIPEPQELPSTFTIEWDLSTGESKIIDNGSES